MRYTNSEPFVEPATMAAAPPVTFVEPFPARVKFVRPYGFTDDDGETWMWYVGQIEADAGTIALLIGRGCIDFIAVV